MARFYFEVFDGQTTFPDTEGQCFASSEALRASAIQSLLEIMRSQNITRDSELMLVVRDASEQPALTARLSLLVSYPV